MSNTEAGIEDYYGFSGNFKDVSQNMPLYQAARTVGVLVGCDFRSYNPGRPGQVDLDFVYSHSHGVHTPLRDLAGISNGPIATIQYRDAHYDVWGSFSRYGNHASAYIGLDPKPEATVGGVYHVQSVMALAFGQLITKHLNLAPRVATYDYRISIGVNVPTERSLDWPLSKHQTYLLPFIET